jgi:hypothetical protein
MNEITVYLRDSDKNEIMALVEYNPSYPKDFKVVVASVDIPNVSTFSVIRTEISNLTMLEAQYAEDILKEIERSSKY